MNLKTTIFSLLHARPPPKGRIKIGNYTRGHPYIFSRDRNQTVNIGKFCLFGPDTMLIVGDYNSPRRCTGYDKIVNYYITKLGQPIIKQRNVKNEATIASASSGSTCTGYIDVGNDVWVGARAIILSNITIGDGAIIGAGTIVSHDVPPYAVVAGIPAKLVRFKFSENQIKRLIEIAWWNWPLEKIIENKECLSGDIDAMIQKHHPSFKDTITP